MGPLTYTTTTAPKIAQLHPRQLPIVDIDSHDEDSDDEEEDLEGFFLGIKQTTTNRIPYDLTVQPQTFNILKIVLTGFNEVQILIYFYILPNSSYPDNCGQSYQI